MRIYTLLIFISALITMNGAALAENSELKSYPLNSADNVITKSGVEFDGSESTDGNGSLKVQVDEPTTINLFETGDLDIENARLIYQAALKTHGLTGTTYLEMWCSFGELGQYFSRALHDPLTGTVDWKLQQTPFYLKEGQNPENIKLNLVINGKGTVWIDDIKVLKAPLD